MSEEKKIEDVSSIDQEKKNIVDPENLAANTVESESRDFRAEKTLDEKSSQRSEAPDDKEIKIGAPQVSVPGNIVSATNDVNSQRERELAIERILATNLDDVFMEMSPDQQYEFRIKGEAVAIEINKELNEPKTKIYKIIDLIKSWLRLIPAVNKFFLEQEAKLKADEIIKLKR